MSAARSASGLIRFSGMTPDEREAWFGREFREIEVLSMEVRDGRPPVTRTVIAGNEVTLIGDPTHALASFVALACWGSA